MPDRRPVGVEKGGIGEEGKRSIGEITEGRKQKKEGEETFLRVPVSPGHRFKGGVRSGGSENLYT